MEKYMDWLAIIVPACLSIIAIIATVLNNKMNIDARKNEMAFEKKIEAYRDIIEKMGNFHFSLNMLINTGTTDTELLQKRHSEFGDSLKLLHLTFDQNGLFFSGKVGRSIGEYKIMFGLYEDKLRGAIGYNYDPEALQEILSTCYKKENEIKSLAQKYLGLDK